MINLLEQLSQDVELQKPSVAATVRLLDDGGTIPFIARYRKEATGGLDEVALRRIQERYVELRELSARRETVLRTIGESGKLTDVLRERIEAAADRRTLEDLYLPYRPKRRTRATIAREAGLEPLAELLWSGSPEVVSRAIDFVGEPISDAAEALAGAQDIVAERLSEDAALRRRLRALALKSGRIAVRRSRNAPEGPTRFDTWIDHHELLARLPSHRYLAIRRGERESVLSVGIDVDGGELQVETAAVRDTLEPARSILEEAGRSAWKRLLGPATETALREILKARSDLAAIDVFAENLREILMAAPLGARPLIALDPGLRTGCKLVVLDQTGEPRGHQVLHLVGSKSARDQSRERLKKLVAEVQPAAIAIGNGKGSREADQLVQEVLASLDDPGAFRALVNEAGASIYSASPEAGAELPDLDVTIRGAVSIGRRLQDPLAELVKIDPRSLGIGQYQHDVDQNLLRGKLSEVVESCVNTVGVDLNTASASLLGYVAGISDRVARELVAHRAEHGPFSSRTELLRIRGLGPKSFEQAAGFLRIRGAQNPLDSTAVHPERYALVARIAQDLGTDLGALVGAEEHLRSADFSRYEDDQVGRYTLADILNELRAPGRDPRREFEPPRFNEGVQAIEDLRPGMQLHATVTNVTKFGCFADLGVHQDGLVHISELSHQFISDPAKVVHVGQKVKAQVLEVDLDRKRIALSIKACRPAPRKPVSAPQSPKPGAAPDPAPRDSRRQRRNEQRNSARSSATGGPGARPKKPRSATRPPQPQPRPAGPFNGLDLSALRDQMRDESTTEDR